MARTLAVVSSWVAISAIASTTLAVSRINEWGTYPVEIWSIDLADPANPVVHDLSGLFQWPFVRDASFDGRTAVAFVWDEGFPTDKFRLV